MEEIKLSAFEYAGEGANGCSYNSLEDPDVMLKLYNAGYPHEAVISEHAVATAVYEAGIPSPQPGDLVSCGDQLGIRFRRIRGKKSYARAIGDDPSQVEELTREFASLCLQLHSTPVSTPPFRDVREVYARYADMFDCFTPADKDNIIRFIQAMPNPGTALHGDLHVGNAVFTLDADGHRQPYFIDLGDFGVGCPLLDLGMMYIICLVNEDDFTFPNFHFHTDVARRMWPIFVHAYFGEDADPAAMEERVRPYAAIKSLLILYNLNGVLLPCFRDLFVRSGLIS